MTTEAAHWSTGPLHTALVSCLPFFVKEPFSETPKLNIPELKVALKMSHEAVYGWLRKSRLSPRNAQKLVDLANTESNIAALRRLGRKPPKIEDFNRFVFA